MTAFAAAPLVQLSARRFAEAVAALVDERPGWHDGRCAVEDSVYVRLRQAMTGRAVVSVRCVAGSRPPLRLDVLALVSEIDRTVPQWGAVGAGQTIPEMLRALACRKWAPEDVDHLDALAAVVEKWTQTAAEVLRDAPPSVPLRVRCPSCGQLWAYRRVGAENVRGYALRASENGASCGACGVEWPTEQFDWLAKLLRG